MKKYVQRLAGIPIVGTLIRVTMRPMNEGDPNVVHEGFVANVFENSFEMKDDLGVNFIVMFDQIVGVEEAVNVPNEDVRDEEIPPIPRTEKQPLIGTGPDDDFGKGPGLWKRMKTNVLALSAWFKTKFARKDKPAKVMTGKVKSYRLLDWIYKNDKVVGYITWVLLFVCAMLMALVIISHYYGFWPFDKADEPTVKPAVTQKAPAAPTSAEASEEAAALMPAAAKTGITNPDKTAAIAAAADDKVDNLKKEVDSLKKNSTLPAPTPAPIGLTGTLPPRTTLLVDEDEWIAGCVKFGGSENGCRTRLKLLQ